jgi:2-haloacid dehalogenase
MTGMAERDPDAICVVACDIFGTTVDWYTGVSGQVAEILGDLGIDLDAGRFATQWRDQYVPSMQRVRDGEREWANLDTLHRESLDGLLRHHGIADAVDERSRVRLVRAWHRLPAWDDAVEGLARLRARYVVATLSNGSFALLTNLVRYARLPFDCIVSAELVHAYKPDPRVYRTAARLLDVDPGQIVMVAAHARDIDGAGGVGLRTAFLERPNEKGPHGSADRSTDVASDVTVSSFLELADRLGC